MDINTLIKVGSLFIILLIAVGMFMIIIAHNKKNKAELLLKTAEIRKQKEIAEQTLITQEKERRHLGMELHDDLGPIFSAVRLYLQQIKQRVTNEQYENLPPFIQNTSDTLNEAIQKFSDVSRVLYPSALNRLGLAEAIDDLIVRAKLAKPEVDFSVVCKIEKLEKELVTVTLYRLCQELINNGIKHSEAKNITFNLIQTGTEVLLEYTDDGIGFNSNVEYEGIGMNSIKSRVNALQGNLAINSSIGQGLKVIINISTN